MQKPDSSDSKVLAAHSFTWIGVQTMFIYMFAFLRYRLPDLNNDQVGSVIDISFLILNGVAAVLPVFILEPITRNIGRVRTHLMRIAIMAVGYLGLFFLGSTPPSSTSRAWRYWALVGQPQ